MNATLRWVKFEAIMIALFQVKGISASKINSFKENHMSNLEIS
jgi:hypothetical protein